MDVLSDAFDAMRAGRPYAELTRVGPSWSMSFPAFSGAGFHAVVAGACDVVRAGVPVLRIDQGDIVFFPRGTAHVLRSAGGGPAELVCGAYQLDRSRPHPVLGDLPEVVHVLVDRGLRPALAASVDLLRDELRVAAPGRDVLLPSLLDVLLVQLMRAWWDRRAGEQGRGWAAALDDGPVGHALAAMHDHPDAPWTVQSLGAHAGLSRAAFARRFTALVGQPPLAYLLWWRLTVAARLLRETDLPLTVVGRRSGYRSAPAFANAFKRAYGTSAGAYRRDRGGDRGDIHDWTPAARSAVSPSS